MCASLKYYLALNEMNVVGPVTIKKLLTVFGQLSEAFAATKTELMQSGVREDVANRIASFDWQLIETSLRWQEKADHHILSIEDDNYPMLLKEIASPPLTLFVKGELEVLQTLQLAIVGSRYPTPMGRENAHNFAQALVQVGLTITSGLALGIDAAGHEGALRAKGKTIAVLGTGLEEIYPAKNRWLAEEIAKHGAVISEFPLTMKAHRENFPRRNRIISGLSVGVLVVEAAIHSGSLITARFALEQGREVFAMPGSIHNALSKGCHRLLKDGAKLVQCAEDIVEEILPFASAISMSSNKKDAKDLTPSERALLNCVDEAPTLMESLLQRSQLSPAQLSSGLLVLEMKGLIRAAMGGYQKL